MHLLHKLLSKSALILATKKKSIIPEKVGKKNLMRQMREASDTKQKQVINAIRIIISMNVYNCSTENDSFLI